MKNYRGVTAVAIASALSTMLISGTHAIEQPFKSPRMSEPTPKKNTTREQQRRLRQQANKGTGK